MAVSPKLQAKQAAVDESELIEEDEIDEPSVINSMGKSSRIGPNEVNIGNIGVLEFPSSIVEETYPSQPRSDIYRPDPSVSEAEQDPYTPSHKQYHIS